MLMYFVETGSKMKKKTSTKIPKHTIAQFRDVVSQTLQSGYFSSCILWAISSKASTMYAIRKMYAMRKTSRNRRGLRPILSQKQRIPFFVRFRNVDLLPKPFSRESFS